jgi:hypothetical protein
MGEIKENKQRNKRKIRKYIKRQVNTEIKMQGIKAKICEIN